VELAEQFLDLTKGNVHYTPLTRRRARQCLEQWQGFLKQIKTRQDRVTIEDFKAFEKHLIAGGRKLSTVNTILSYVTMYYSILADQYPRSKWPSFYAQVKTHKKPKVRASSSPFEPYPIEVIPEILEVSKECQCEDFEVVAGLIYTGMRVQMYGLRLKDLDFHSRMITTRVKGGHEVKIPMHKTLAQIWKAHIETRDYDSDQLFRLGYYPYGFVEGDGKRDAYSNSNNRQNVRRVLKRVQEALEKRGIREKLQAHRFRKSVGTYASEYGLDETDRRILLSHGAKNITQQYDLRDIRKVRDKWDRIDLGSKEWVQARSEVVLSPTPENGGSQTFQELLGRIKENNFSKDERLQLISALMEG